MESLALSAAGGAVGVLCAWWGVSAMARASILSSGSALQSPSWKVLAFSAGVTLLTGLLFGLAPAFRATRLSLAESIKDGGAAGQGTSRMMLAKGLVAGQVALSLALLVGASLFIRTLRNLQNVDVGFQRENVLVADIDPTNLGYRGHRLRAFYDELLERAGRLPGVRSAGLSTMTPMGMYSLSYSFSAEGYQAKPGEHMVGTRKPRDPRLLHHPRDSHAAGPRLPAGRRARDHPRRQYDGGHRALQREHQRRPRQCLPRLHHR